MFSKKYCKLHEKNLTEHVNILASSSMPGRSEKVDGRSELIWGYYLFDNIFNNM